MEYLHASQYLIWLPVKNLKDKHVSHFRLSCRCVEADFRQTQRGTLPVSFTQSNSNVKNTLLIHVNDLVLPKDVFRHIGPGLLCFANKMHHCNGASPWQQSVSRGADIKSFTTAPSASGVVFWSY